VKVKKAVERKQVKVQGCRKRRRRSIAGCVLVGVCVYSECVRVLVLACMLSTCTPEEVGVRTKQ